MTTKQTPSQKNPPTITLQHSLNHLFQGKPGNCTGAIRQIRPVIQVVEHKSTIPQIKKKRAKNSLAIHEALLPAAPLI